MDNERIFEVIKNNLAEGFGLGRDKILLDSYLVNDLGLDFADVAASVLDIGELLNVNIIDDEIFSKDVKDITINDIVEAVQKNWKY